MPGFLVSDVARKGSGCGVCHWAARPLAAAPPAQDRPGGQQRSQHEGDLEWRIDARLDDPPVVDHARNSGDVDGTMQPRFQRLPPSVRMAQVEEVAARGSRSVQAVTPAQMYGLRATSSQIADQFQVE